MLNHTNHLPLWASKFLWFPPNYCTPKTVKNLRSTQWLKHWRSQLVLTNNQRVMQMNTMLEFVLLSLPLYKGNVNERKGASGELKREGLWWKRVWRRDVYIRVCLWRGGESCSSLTLFLSLSLSLYLSSTHLHLHLYLLLPIVTHLVTINYWELNLGFEVSGFDCWELGFGFELSSLLSS